MLLFYVDQLAICVRCVLEWEVYEKLSKLVIVHDFSGKSLLQTSPLNKTP